MKRPIGSRGCPFCGSKAGEGFSWNDGESWFCDGCGVLCKPDRLAARREGWRKGETEFWKTVPNGALLVRLEEAEKKEGRTA